MTRRIFCLVAAAALAAAACPLAAATVDEVIAKHVAARGGDAWEKVHSLKLTGSYTAFSKTAAFTLYRKRDDRYFGDKYYFDHVENERPVVIGYDGETVWWRNPYSGYDWPQRVTGIDRVVQMQEVDFVDPLFTYREKGWQAELAGSAEIEGRETIRIDLERGDGSQETWYLDPETYLEVARDATGTDLGGQEFPQRTFYDDFRDVEGVKIPFFSETQWYARNRIMEIEDVEVNADVDDALFRMPFPEGMEELQALVGTWEVKVESRPQPAVPWQERKASATVTSLFDGALLRERLVDEGGAETIRTYSYDRFRQRYRVTQMLGTTLYQDVHEGTMKDGRLSVSNIDTGTTWSGFGFTFNQRNSVFEIGDDGFKVEQELSVDGGNHWFLADRLTYTRAEE